MAWIFCPGHAGVVGNERADKLAGEAVLGEAVPLDPATIVSTLTDWYNNNRVVAPSNYHGCVEGEKVQER